MTLLQYTCICTPIEAQFKLDNDEQRNLFSVFQPSGSGY